MNRTLVYFTRELPGLSDDLLEYGFQIYEALAVSEVLYLCEQHPKALVVIDHTVEPDAAKTVAQKHMTLQLKPEATAADVLWELSQLFGSNARVQ